MAAPRENAAQAVNGVISSKTFLSFIGIGKA
jgi:hypothetical protein